MADYLDGVGRRLEQLRRAHGLNQEDAAHQVGVAVKTWRNWENGHRAPYERNWRKIQEGFDLSDGDIGDLRGKPPTPLGLGDSDGGSDQLDRIEAKLDDVLRLLALREAERAAREAEQLAERSPRRRRTG